MRNANGALFPVQSGSVLVESVSPYGDGIGDSAVSDRRRHWREEGGAIVSDAQTTPGVNFSWTWAGHLARALGAVFLEGPEIPRSTDAIYAYGPKR
jgi:hypothetical protein